MFEDFPTEHDKMVSELCDLRPGAAFDIVVSGHPKVWRVILDSVLGNSIIVHQRGGKPIRLSWYGIVSISLPE